MRVRLVLALSAALIPGVGMLGAESAQGGGGRGPEAPARRAPTASAVWAPRTRGGPAAAGGRLVLTTAPPLRPGFQPADPDYTVACARRRMVDIHARVPRGERLSINGHAATTSIHERIPLAAGEAFTFVVGGSGPEVAYHVRCTPPGFPTWRVRRNARPQFKWLIFTPGNGPYIVIADAWGVPVWWIRSPSGGAVNASVLPDGSVAWWNPGDPSGDADEGYYSIYSLTGVPLRNVSASDADGRGEVGANLHDFQQLPDGDFLLFANVPRTVASLAPYGGPDTTGIVLDAVIQLVTPRGRLLWSWDSADHIMPSETEWDAAYQRTTWNGQTAYDIVHMNSIQEVTEHGCAIAPTATAPATCTIVLSARYLDAVYSISMATGEITWKLGGTYVPGESLSFVGDPYANFSGQHFARLLPNGTLTLLDNGTLDPRRRPRVVAYRLEAGLAVLRDDVTDWRIQHSQCCGSAQILPGGDWLVDWGGNPITAEITPRGAHVFSLTLPRGFAFRAVAVSPAITRSRLIAAMNAQLRHARQR